MQIFAWRVATQSLATKHNTFRRTIVKEDTCALCGMESEDEFHAVVSCTRSRALRAAMRAKWDIPKEVEFRRTEEEWLQHLILPQSASIRSNILLILWKAWSLRNNTIHGDGKDTVTGAMHQLLRLGEELLAAEQAVNMPVSKQAITLFD